MYEMKESGIEWIGQIPKHWEVRRMKYCFNSHVVGSWGQEQLYNNNDIICIRVADFAFDKMSIATKAIDEYTKRNYSNHIISKLILHQNDILIEKSGGGDNTPVGRCIIVDIDYMAVYSNFIERLRVISLAYPKYMQYILFSFYKSNCIYNYIKQTIGIQNLDISMMFNVEKVIFPPLDEQKKIADFLDNKVTEIDNLIDDTKKLIDKYKEYKQSLITEIVTKGLNHNVEMKESGIEWIGQIPKHWKLSRLKYILNRPLQYGANEAGVSYDENLARYIRITDITKDNKLKKNDMLSLPDNISIPYILKPGDILFARSGATVGKTFLYIQEYGKSAFAGYLIKARINKRKALYKYIYLYTLSKSYEIWKNRIFIQSTIQNIAADKYRELNIPLPPINEQEEIVRYFDDKCQQIDNIIEEKQSLIEKLEEYKKSLIYEYVTGKKQVENE